MMTASVMSPTSAMTHAGVWMRIVLAAQRTVVVMGGIGAACRAVMVMIGIGAVGIAAAHTGMENRLLAALLHIYAVAFMSAARPLTTRQTVVVMGGIGAVRRAVMVVTGIGAVGIDTAHAGMEDLSPIIFFHITAPVPVSQLLTPYRAVVVVPGLITPRQTGMVVGRIGTVLKVAPHARSEGVV